MACYPALWHGLMNHFQRPLHLLTLGTHCLRGLPQCKTACDDAPGCTSVYYDAGQLQCYLKQGECIYNDTCVVRQLHFRLQLGHRRG